jgi:hypothetical protein
MNDRLLCFEPLVQRCVVSWGAAGGGNLPKRVLPVHSEVTEEALSRVAEVLVYLCKS